MAKRTGDRPSAAKRGKPRRAPEQGELVWLTFSPQAGRVQAGRRPALVLSPFAYNEKTGLCLACPVTSQVKGYPFEAALPAGLTISGVILVDQLKCCDWYDRDCERIGQAPPEVLDQVAAKLRTLLPL